MTTRHYFNQELHRLQDEILALGGTVEKALVESVELLGERDLEGARRLYDADRAINEKRYAIEADTLKLIATQQPMAGDMRLLAAILEIAGELERIGDYAKGIAKITLMQGAEPLLKPLIDLPRMAQKASDMLHRSLAAFIARDVAAARSIPREDDEIDALYNQITRELLTYIMADPSTITRATHLMWASHNLERAADRVTNVCERVVFTVTGELSELDEDSINAIG